MNEKLNWVYNNLSIARMNVEELTLSQASKFNLKIRKSHNYIHDMRIEKLLDNIDCALMSIDAFRESDD